MEEKQEKEFSINDLIKIFWDRKVLIAGVASILTVFILLLGASYRYNRMMTQVTFEAYWPGIEDQLYINNTLFNSRDLINPVLLEKAKPLFADNASMNEKLKHINFEWFVLRGFISANQYHIVVDSEEERENLLTFSRFSITFDSNAIGLTHSESQLFIEVYLREIFFGYFLRNKNNSLQHRNNLREELEKTEYIDIISFIRTQRNDLDRAIAQLREYAIISSSNLERLNALERSILNFFIRNNPDILLMDIQEKGFFRDVANIDNISSRILLLDVMIDERMQLIQLYNDAYANFNDISSIFPELNIILHELPELNTRRIRYQRIFEAMNGTTPFTQEALVVFEQRLLGFIDQFDEFYSEFQEHTLSIREDNTILLITSKNITIPFPMAYLVIGSLFASAVLATSVGFIYEFWLRNKEKIISKTKGIPKHD